MPFHLVLALLFIAGLGLMGLALSGYGSPDRSHETPPRYSGPPKGPSSDGPSKT